MTTAEPKFAARNNTQASKTADKVRLRAVNQRRGRGTRASQARRGLASSQRG